MRSQRDPPASARRVRRQDADHGAGVVQLTAQHGLVRLVEVDPADGHGVLLALAGEALLVGDASEVPGQEYTQRFGDTARRTEVVDQDVPAAGSQVGLLVKLPGRAQPGWLPRDVQQSRGQLPLERTDGVAILLDQQNLVAVPDLPQCHDRDRARVLHVLARDLACFTEVDALAPDVPDHPLEHDSAVSDRTPLDPVGQVSATQDLGIQTHRATMLIADPDSSWGNSGWAATLMAPQRSGCPLAFQPRPGVRPCVRRLQPRPARRRAGVRGSAGTGTPGEPGWRRSTGAPRPAVRRTRRGCRP